VGLPVPVEERNIPRVTAPTSPPRAPRTGVAGPLLALVRRALGRARDPEEAARARERAFTAELEDRLQQRTAELQRHAEALLRTQRLEVVGRLAGGVAHDFNNILTAVIACTEALRAALSPPPPAARRRAEAILGELDDSAERAVQLTRQFVTLGRSTTLRIEPIDLAALVERMAPMLRRLLGASITLTLPRPGPPARVRGDRSQLEQLVLNLVVNARDAMPRGGRLQIEVERAGASALLTVSDTGTGMDEVTRARMFEPFFTTKGPGRGTGIGLVVVAEVVRRTSGRIDVESRLGHGTRVRVTFPATEARPAPAAPAAEPPTSLAPLRVLLVEDDAAVRRHLASALAAAGHRVHETGDPAEAERMVAREAGAFDALVCDLVLPGSSGLELVERFRALGVGAPVVFISGYSQEEVAERIGALSGATFLQKPFAPVALLRSIREAAGIDGVPRT
jgi:signal transduction histidine kinase